MAKLPPARAQLGAARERAKGALRAEKAIRNLPKARKKLAETRKQAKDLARAEQAMRMEFFEFAGRVTPYVAVVSGPATYFVSTTDDHIGKDLFAKQARKEMRVLTNALAALEAADAPASRGVFIDAGAHIGTTSIEALMTHKFESAVAIEPDLANLGLLRVNSMVNGLGSRLNVIDAAVSDGEGFAELDLGNGSAAKRSLLSAGEKAGSGGTRRVRTISLDSLADDGTVDPADVSLVWMDVEGHEGHVFGGAQKLLERRVPIVLEYCPRLLEQAGRLDKLHELIKEHYTDVLDLRLRWSGEPPVVPAEQIGDLAEHYGREGARPDFTDLLVFARP